MKLSIPGIHHVTAITADAQKNIDFYTGVLGLRLVKLTVNYDDPGSYHLYYGDELGRPGTIMTFFAWQGAQRGRTGPPQATAVAFVVPASALDYWTKRLKDRNVKLQSSIERFGERVLEFTDPDGIRLEIVAVTEPNGQPWSAGPIPAEYAIQGFNRVTISEKAHEKTATLLTDVMGFKAQGSDQNRYRYSAGTNNGFASTIDVLNVPEGPRGTMGAGAIHHVAFRTADDAQQEAWRKEIASLGYNVSPMMDRVYFHSIYYREPGGVLFEIATDGPGFTADQVCERLGTKLMLPSWLERHRSEIEQAVPPVRLPPIPTPAS